MGSTGHDVSRGVQFPLGVCSAGWVDEPVTIHSRFVTGNNAMQMITTGNVKTHKKKGQNSNHNNGACSKSPDMSPLSPQLVKEV